MTAVQKFILKRLQDMYKAPGMWASTDEAFGMQVATLAEIWWVDRGLEYTRAVNILEKLMGLLPTEYVPVKPLDDEWARKCVDTFREYLV